MKTKPVTESLHQTLTDEIRRILAPVIAQLPKVDDDGGIDLDPLQADLVVSYTPIVDALGFTPTDEYAACAAANTVVHLKAVASMSDASDGLETIEEHKDRLAFDLKEIAAHVADDLISCKFGRKAEVPMPRTSRDYYGHLDRLDRRC